MKYKANWEQTRQRWSDYWKRKNSGMPLMCVIARNPETEDAYRAAAAEGRKLYAPVCQGCDPTLPDSLMYADMDDKYRNARRMVERYRHFCETHAFLADSFPNINVDFGPGSLAAYLGSNIVFNDDTVWFEHFVEDWANLPPLKYDPENAWWKEHFQLVKNVRELAGEDFCVAMPDLMENIDVLASMRGAQDIIFDMMDEPEEVKKRIDEIGALYFDYYDRLYDMIGSETDGGSAYTVFQIWGPGRTAKLQCDFAAMLSPDQFREHIQESLRGQARRLDNVLFHLDGPDCIRHMDALMEIEEIDALQWTSGDHGPDGTQEEWYQIYDKARAAGKSIWVKVYTGEFEDWVKNAERMVMRYGSRGTFFMFPEMSMEQADILLARARDHWSDIPGEIGV